jgi:Divalent cation transporter
MIRILAIALAAALAPLAALAEPCPGNSQALGTERVIEVDAKTTPRVGRKHFPSTLPLRAKELVLTFDDGPWPVTTPKVLDALKHECAFAVITGVAAYIWFKVPGLGIVIGLAMICNLIAAALGGILIPLALHRLRIDPAVASSPFVTTVTDVVGFFSFLSIATLWFGLR